MSSAIEAFHIPGFRPDDVTEWSVREYGDDLVLRFPVLEPDYLGRVLVRLKRARAKHLANRPVDGIARTIGAAAERLTNANDPHRRALERALPAITGYAPEMIRVTLDRMAADWRHDALNRLLEAEFANPGVLDGFRPVAGTGPDRRRINGPAGRPPGGGGTGAAADRRLRAYGPELAFHVFAGNVPGVAVTSLVRSLLVKAATFGKSGSGEPLFAALFARILADVDPGLGDCLAVTYWPGGEQPLEEAALDTADTIVVYGGEDPARVWSARTAARTDTRLVIHGPRLSFAAIGRDALTPETAGPTATSAAQAVALFDQQGCVSPHVLYIEAGAAVSPPRFAEMLADALGDLQTRLPRGRISAGEAARIHEARAAAEFRDPDRPAARVIAPATLDYTVIYDEDPAFTPSCLNRVVYVKPLSDLEEAARHVAPFSRYLQTVAIAGAGDHHESGTSRRREALAEKFGSLGASRVTDLVRMPWPPPTWHHDGRGPLRELVRWVDLEG